MEISTRDLVTVLHGMGFGALFMLAFSGAMAELFHLSAMPAQVRTSGRARTLLTVYLIGMVALAWLAVFSGAYIVYPWYRAVPPAGVTDLSDTRGASCSRAAEHPSGTISAWNGRKTWRGLRQSP